MDLKYLSLHIATIYYLIVMNFLLNARPTVPPGFSIQIYRTAFIDHPTGMVWGPDGKLYVAEMNSGVIKIVEDRDQDGVGDAVSIFAEGFTQPVGLAWKGDSLYVSSRWTITIVRDTDGDNVADFYDPIITDWPAHWHQNNQVIFDEEGWFFVALGSWEDRTHGPLEYNNKILRISPDGSEIQVWVDGIRNVFDIAFSPQGYMFGGDNGWQEQTPDGQPEELNYFAEGRHYGYPDYIGHPPDTSSTFGPQVTFPDHTSPTGVMFYTGDQFPEEYRNDLFVAFYGPDNWTESFRHKAYRIVRCEVVDSTIVDTMEFASNFYRPIDIIQDSIGNLYVSDLGQFFSPEVDGHIYKISYIGATGIQGQTTEIEQFELFQNYPNPFNSETEIRYSLRQASQVKLSIFNILGQEIATLIDGKQSAGTHRVAWNGKNDENNELPSGIYLYRIEIDKSRPLAKKMLLVK